MTEDDDKAKEERNALARKVAQQVKLIATFTP
jgi:hypothetical protein